MKNICQIFILVFILVSCSTNKVIIETNPAGAEVYSRETGKTVEKSLGVTPLELSQDQLDEIVKDPTKPVVLKITKHGYSEEKIIVSDFGSSSVNYNFLLKENTYAEIISQIDNTSSDLFEAQRLMRVGNIDGSIKILEALLKDYKQSSLINELMASAYYIKQNYKKSLFYYETAYKYDSKNFEAYKMKKYLENKLGVKRPLEANNS